MVSKRFIVVLLAGLLFSATSRGDEPGTQEIIDRAVKAMGGEAALSKAETFVLKLFVHNGTEALSIDTHYYKLMVKGLELSRLEEYDSDFFLEGGEAQTFWVRDRGEIWYKANGRVGLDNGAGTFNLRDYTILYAAEINLLPLRDKASKVELIGEKIIDDRPALGLNVLCQGFRFDMYFDKETGLPVRSFRLRTPQTAAQKTSVTRTYSGFKDYFGVKIPSQHVATTNFGLKETKPMLAELVELRFLDEIEPGLFAKPN